MTTNSECPPEALLRDLIADRLEPDVARRLVEHIDQCAVCQSRLAEPDWLGDLAAQLPDLVATKQHSALLQTALENTKSMGGRPTQRKRGNDDGAFDVVPDVTGFTRDGYELIEKIGQGGMGYVYKAREQSLDRIVAIKVLSPLLANEESSRKRFLREARSAAAVVHPNVITIHAISEKPPLPYLVMEFVEGVSLQQHLDANSAIRLDNVVRIGRQIAAGLSAAHGKGVIHRDIKPANIFLNIQTGKVLLGDFGLARAANQSHLTRTGTVIGTPAYVAPEVLEDPRSADHRADLFSLGAVIYAMCCGESPFQADTLLATLRRLSSVQPKPLSERAPGVPDWLSDIVMRLLKKNPEERFQSAADFREALGRGVGLGVKLALPDRRMGEVPTQAATGGTQVATASIESMSSMPAEKTPQHTVPRDRVPRDTVPQDTAVRNDDDVTRPLRESNYPTIRINTERDSDATLRPRKRKRDRSTRVWGTVAVSATTLIAVALLVNSLGGFNGAVESSSNAPADSIEPHPSLPSMFADEDPVFTDEDSVSVNEDPVARPPRARSATTGSVLEPFVCLDSTGKRVDSFASLQDAIDSQSGDHRIEIHSSQTIPVDSCLVAASSVAIAAGEGFSPKLELFADGEIEWDAMFHVRGELALEGLELRLLAADEEDDVSLVYVTPDGGLLMDDCVLVVEGHGTCVSSQADISVSNCLFHAPQSTAIQLEPVRETQTVLRNCWVSGESALECFRDARQDLEIVDCTFACEQIICTYDEDDPVMGTLSIESRGSVYACTVALFEFSGNGDQWFDQRLEWDGSGNAFSGDLFSNVDDEVFEGDHEPADADDWLDRLLQTGSFVEAPLVISDDELAERITQLDFRLSELETSFEVIAGAKRTP